MVTIIIVGSALLIITAMGFIVKLLSNKISKLKNEIAQKDFAIERAAQNIKVLTDHQRLIQKIRTQHKSFIDRIGKVKEGDNEEIDNILRDVVTLNNISVSKR